MIPTKPIHHPKIRRNLLACFKDEEIHVEANISRRPKKKRGKQGNTSPALIVATNIKINGEPAPSISHVCLAMDSDSSEFNRVSKQLNVSPGTVQRRTFKAVPYSYGKGRYSLKVTN